MRTCRECRYFWEFPDVEKNCLVGRCARWIGAKPNEKICEQFEPLILEEEVCGLLRLEGIVAGKQK